MVKSTAIFRCITAFTLWLCQITLSAAEVESSVLSSPSYIIISSHDTIFSLVKNTVIYDDTFGLHTTYHNIPNGFYKPLSNFTPSRNHHKITRVTHFLKFQLFNRTSDTIHGFFYCGKHNLLTLWSDGDSLVKHGGLSDYSDVTSKLFSDYYLPVTLRPQQTKVFFVSAVNYGVVPASIDSELFLCPQNPRIDKLQQPLYYFWLLITSAICGGILILSIFNFAQYFTASKPEYFFYGCYGLAMFFNIERAAEWGFNLRIVSQLFPNYFFTSATLLNVFAGIFYFLFTRFFLDLKSKSVVANRTVTVSICLLLPGAVILAYGIWFEIDGAWLLVCFRTLSLLPTFLLLVLTVSIYATLRNSSPLLLYYYLGFALLFMGVGINIYINNFARHLLSEKFPAIFTVEISVLLEMILFALGLGYKARLTEKQKIEADIQNLKLQHQNEINLLQVRHHLSRDLHDDIGSTLSSINILSRTAQNSLKQANDEKTKAALEKISERSQRLLDNLSDIIWNINPGNDTIEDVMSRMCEYATTILEAKNIECSIDFPKEKVDCQLNMQAKSNLYLIFKEAVNNLSKYSEATQASLSLILTQTDLHLTITDNGIGFNMIEVKRRGGLVNMVQRAEEMKGTITIKSAKETGTTIKLVVPRY